jgi:hypothetical protein
VIEQINLQLTASPTVVTHQNQFQRKQFKNKTRLTILQLPVLQLPILMVFVLQQVVLQLSLSTHGVIQILQLLILNTVVMLVQLVKTFAILTSTLQAQLVVAIFSQTVLSGSISIKQNLTSVRQVLLSELYWHSLDLS